MSPIQKYRTLNEGNDPTQRPDRSVVMLGGRGEGGQRRLGALKLPVQSIIKLSICQTDDKHVSFNVRSDDKKEKNVAAAGLIAI